MNMKRLVVVAVVFVASLGFASVQQALASDEAAAKPVELPAWLQSMKFSGDLRLRYEGSWYDDPAMVDKQHGRFRLRFGVEKQINEEWFAAFRLASGSGSDPTSTNQTLTNNFDKKTIWIDLAYLTHKPAAVPNLVVVAGKLKNPWVNTFIVWDGDVNPEGISATYKAQVAEGFTPFVTLSQMSSFENGNMGADDASMWAAQAGCNWSVTDGVTWIPTVAYYDWQSYCEAGNWSKSNGNTHAGGVLTAGDFNILDVVNTFKFDAFGVPVAITADYAVNTAEDAPAPDCGEDTAYAGIIRVGGSIKDKGQWSADYTYARVEKNAVVGAFSDSDFGYANRKGHKFGFNYGLAKNVVGGLALYITEPVSGTNKVEQTLFQADIVLLF